MTRTSKLSVETHAVLTAMLLIVASAPSSRAASEGADIVFGGCGAGPGQFEELQDIAFGPGDSLYVLEGRREEKGALKGNCRVQIFQPDGKFVSQFSIADDALGDRDRPRRLAVDASGRVWVTRPEADSVRVYGPEGERWREFSVPGAMAVTTWRQGDLERIVAIGSTRRVIDRKWSDVGGDELFVFQPDSGTDAARVPLQRKLTEVVDMTSDRAGSLYVLAATNQLYAFSPKGRLLASMGSSSRTRNPDGSELIHSVSVDSRGFIYSVTWGNPSWIVRFSPDSTKVWRREGQYKWADAWGPHSRYTPLAIDSQDRLWVASTAENTGNPRAHASPSVMRLREDFLEEDGGKKVVVRDGRLLGFSPDLASTLPYDVAYGPGDIPMRFSVAPAMRRIRSVDVAWKAVGFTGASVGEGRFSMPLTDGVAATNCFSFRPPALGWYTVSAEIRNAGALLQAIGHHVVVTREYPGLPKLAEGESSGGWEDAPRQRFSGLPTMRLHVTDSVQSQDKLDVDIEQARRYGATCFVQISDKRHCTPENVRALVTRFKGRVPCWEFVNEPNFSMSPEDCAKMFAELHPLVKEIDPDAQVLGPAVCGISLGWHERFFKAGGGAFVDVLSVHDYEGHETIDPVHWRWKFPALRSLAEKYGCGDKPIWQTERCITGVRGNQFLGPAQAVRLTLHRDLLESLGIPPRHNSQYYLSQGGYAPVPAYIWSRSGPHPAVAALRVRHALTEGAGLHYSRAFDFGPQGNTLFMGLLYEGENEGVAILRNFGLPESEPMALSVTGGASELALFDAFGNAASVPVRDGIACVDVPQMPVYIRLEKGQGLSVPRYDFGTNLAFNAAFAYSGTTERDLALLNNGILETTHAESPHGGTDGKQIWLGRIETDASGKAVPETLDILLGAKRTVNAVLLHGSRADNPFTALLDYDLLYRDGDRWVELTRIRSRHPASDEVETAQSRANTWILDDNLHLDRFAPVATDALRIIVRRTTHGFFPDAMGLPVETLMPQALMLREVEVFGPPSPR
jgi:sugar lactone lactonase YvrE